MFMLQSKKWCKTTTQASPSWKDSAKLAPVYSGTHQGRKVMKLSRLTEEQLRSLCNLCQGQGQRGSALGVATNWKNKWLCCFMLFQKTKVPICSWKMTNKKMKKTAGSNTIWRSFHWGLGRGFGLFQRPGGWPLGQQSLATRGTVFFNPFFGMFNLKDMVVIGCRSSTCSCVFCILKSYTGFGMWKL